MLHTFEVPYYTKNKKYMKNVIANTFFMYFSFLCVEGPNKSIEHGYSLDEESNSASNKGFLSKFE